MPSDELDTSQDASPWTTPNGGAWAYRYTGDTELASPLLTSSGRVIFTATEQQSGKAAGTMTAIDIVTRDIVWKTVFGTGVHATPDLSDGVIYAGNNDGVLYAIDESDGRILWTYKAGGTIVSAPYTSETGAGAPTIIYFGDTNGRFYAVNHQTHQNAWAPFQTWVPAGAQAVFTQATICGTLIVFAASVVSSDGKSSKAHIYGLDAVNGALAFDVPIETTAILSGGQAAAPLTFFGCEDGTFLAFDITTKQVAWSIKTGGPILGTSAIANGYVYFGSGDGALYARQYGQGQSDSWQLPVSQSIITGITLAGNEAYFGGMAGSKSSALYSIDLSRDVHQSATVAVDQLQGRVGDTPFANGTHIAFVDAGSGAGTVYALEQAFSSMTDRVAFTSRLIPRTYTSQTDASDATYQMIVTVSDGSRTPMPSTPVKIRASEPTEVEINGGTARTIGPSTSQTVDVETDAAGQITLIVKADLYIASFFFEPDFFQPGLSVQFFPDQANLDRLSTMEGSELTGAQDYGHQPVFLPKYTTADQLNHVATTIRNTVGRQQNTSTSSMKTTTATTTRNLAPAEFEAFNVDIDAQGKYVFAPQDAAAVAGERSSSSGDDWDKFRNSVAHGTQKLRHAAWRFSEKSAKVYVEAEDELGKLVPYNIIVDSIERAIETVRAFIKEVVTDIEKFVEFLSFLFDWKAICDLQKQFIATINPMLEQFHTYVLQADSEQAVTAFLTGLATEAKSLFVAQTNAQTDSAGSTTQSAGSADDVFRPKGDDVSVMAAWLAREVRKAFEGLTGKLDIPGAKELSEATTTFLHELETILAKDVYTALKDIFDGVVKAFQDLFSGAGFLSRLLKTILSIFEELIDLGFALVIELVPAAFAYFRDALAAVITMMNAELHIPGLSELYSLITGEKLRLLDLACLLVAIPAHLIIAITDEARKSVSGGGGLPPRDANIGIASAYILLSVLWVAQTVIGETPAIFDLGVSAFYTVITATQAALMIEERDFLVQDWTWYLLQLFPVLFSAATAILPEPKDPPAPLWQEKIWFAFGCGSAVATAVYALKYPKQYADPNGLTFDANLLGGWPLFAPYARNSPKPTTATITGATVLSILGYGGSSAITMTLAAEE